MPASWRQSRGSRRGRDPPGSAHSTGAITSNHYGTAKPRAARTNWNQKTKHDNAKRRHAEAKEFENPNCPC